MPAGRTRVDEEPRVTLRALGDHKRAFAVSVLASALLGLVASVVLRGVFGVDTGSTFASVTLGVATGAVAPLLFARLARR